MCHVVKVDVSSSRTSASYERRVMQCKSTFRVFKKLHVSGVFSLIWFLNLKIREKLKYQKRPDFVQGLNAAKGIVSHFNASSGTFKCHEKILIPINLCCLEIVVTQNVHYKNDSFSLGVYRTMIGFIYFVINKIHSVIIKWWKLFANGLFCLFLLI